MEEYSIFELNTSFEFEGKHSEKNVSFYKNHVQISSESSSTNIKYTDISRISYNSESVKIILRDGSKIKIPCGSSDLKKIRTIFRSKKESEIKEMKGSALVNLKDLYFIVPIQSNDIKILKFTIMQRISSYFYPACETASISVDVISGISIYCTFDKGEEVELINSEDLEAALIFCSGKLKLAIKD